jgi:hypothetical protein
MGHEAAEFIPAAAPSLSPAPGRRSAAKRGLVPQWFVVLTILLVASVVVERAKTPPAPASASRITVESWRFNRT